MYRSEDWVRFALALTLPCILIQRYSFKDGWGAAIGKGLLVGVLTAIPLPLGSPATLAGGVIGLLRPAKSLNLLSMMGLMLGVGMLVDNAIVVLEAIERVNRELGTLTVIITHNAVIAEVADRVAGLVLVVLAIVVLVLAFRAGERDSQYVPSA